MPITDAEPAANTGIDYKEMAAATGQAVVSSLMQAGMIGQKKEEPVTVSEFEKQLAAIEANPESDPATVATMKQLFASFQKDIVGTVGKKQQEELHKALAEQRDTNARALIVKAVEEHIVEGSVAERYASVIGNKIIELFNEGTTDEIKAARLKYAKGEIDIKLLNKLAKQEVEAFGAEAPKTRSSSGMAKRDNVSESGSALTGAEMSESANIDPQKDLSEKERALYYARQSNFMRTQLKPNSPEAKARAKEFAFQGVVNMRNGKNKKA